MRETIFVWLGASLLLACTARAYGPAGHQIVGGIADELLANKPAGAKVSALLNGMTLQKASVIPDEIKGWDEKGVDDPKSFHYSRHPELDRQLRDFWRANQPTHDLNSAMPSHHWFHYTDVPLIRGEKYEQGKAGRSKWDIVHMIPYCIDVLQGRIPENNARKITKPVAVILLAHYVADIHQPLHVGAEYFNRQGEVVDPDKDKSALGDEGANTIALRLLDSPPPRRGAHTKKLHAFWDLDAVNALLPPVPETMPKDQRRAQNEAAEKAIIHKMAAHEPKNWRMPPNLKLDQYAEAWADEILPIALEAHQRLTFKNVKPLQQEDRVVAAGEADEKPEPDHLTYRAWATNVVRDELHKAGWRLADLLEKALTPSITTPVSSASLPSTASPSPGRTPAGL
jgi:S1/P1 Nuclease